MQLLFVALKINLIDVCCKFKKCFIFNVAVEDVGIGAIIETRNFGCWDKKGGISHTTS